MTDVHQWRAIMREYEEGEETQRDFCKKRALRFYQFGYWRKRLRGYYKKKPAVNEGTSFQSVRIQDVSIEKDIIDDITIICENGLKISVKTGRKKRRLRELVKEIAQI